MYWDPFEELERMHEEIDRLFRKSFLEFMPEVKYGNRKDLLDYDKKDLVPMENRLIKFRTPVCHLQETENKIIASFELPGVDKKDIDLNVDDNTIELKVESKDEKKHEDNEKKMYSYRMQSFFRRIPLSIEVDSSKATAEYKDGMLRVEIPKKQNDKNKKKLEIK